MLDWLSLILLFCSLVSLALFIFILRFAVKTEMVITTTIFTFIVTAGLFSWTMLSASGAYVDLWYRVAYLCAILMFPILIILFLQRAGSTSFLVTKASGRAILFGPFVAQLLAHYLLPEDLAELSDFVFLIAWLAITLHVWKILFTKMQEASSMIRKNQMEFMLSSFFVAILYNLILIFNLLFPTDVAEFSLLYSLGVVGALMITIRGLVRYQVVIGTELLVRNSLILMLTSLICVNTFVLAQLTVIELLEPLETTTQLSISTLLVIIIVLSINPINRLSAVIVEKISPQLKWQESNIKEIFVLHSSGLVIAHTSLDVKTGEIDRDMVGGMLTAIQNFVQEAFHESEMESLKSLNMGKLRMLIEAKGDVVVAVLFTGHEAMELRKDLHWMLDELDHRFGEVLHIWKGDKSSVLGVQKWIEKVLRSTERGWSKNKEINNLMSYRQ